MRENDEKRRYEIESYMQRDTLEVPGWLFLTPSILSLYGICPHLDVTQPPEIILSLRKHWLDNRIDGGDAYRAAFATMASDTHPANLVKHADDARLNLTQAVRAAFECHPRPLPALDPLLEVITSYKQSKNRSKKVKTAWEKTMEDIRTVQAEITFDMLLYYDLLTGAKITKVTIADLSTGTGDDKLQDCVRAVISADKALKTHREHVHTQYTKATDKLYDLICAGFVIEQEGRYFKRWYNLSDEEKRERIGSFCEHYLGTLGTLGATNDRQRLLGELRTFVEESLAKKTLKISEVKWSTKAGKIETINRLQYNGESFFLAVEDEEAKRIRRNKVVLTNHKKEIALKNVDAPRLNRVLLKRILMCPTQKKDAIVDFVLWKCCMCSAPQARSSTRDHLVSAYQAICDIIRAAPPPPPSLNLNT